MASSRLSEPPPLGRTSREQRRRSDDRGCNPGGHPGPPAAAAKLRRHNRERRQRLDGLDLDQPHRLLEPLQPHGPALAVTNPLDLLSQRDGRLGRKDLSRLRKAAQPCCRVQRSAAVPALDRDGFTRVEPDPDRERKERTALRPPAKRSLQLDRRPDRLSSRAEDAQRLVAAKLDHLHRRNASDDLARQPGEPRRKPCRLLVAVGLGEARVPADVRDQERVDVGHGLLAVGRHLPLLGHWGDTTAPGAGGPPARRAAVAARSPCPPLIGCG